MICKNCGTECKDTAKFCRGCGAPLTQEDNQDYTMVLNEPVQPQAPAPAPVQAQQQNYNYNYDQQAHQAAHDPYVQPYDHTREFTAKDISENKVVALACYMLGAVGVIIALLAAHTSPFAGFHVRQKLKLMITEALIAIFSALLCWTFIIPIIGAIMIGILQIINIICFFSAGSGNAKEPVIVRSLGFLK